LKENRLVKVVFIADVPDVALAGETREVADGYGRNYLLPKKLAVLADSAASNIVKAQMKQVLVKRAQAETEMKEIAGKLDGTEITIKAKAGEKERLYGSVTSADIAGELSRISGAAIDKRKIELEEPLRQLGVHEVTLKFAHDISAVIKVNVAAEEAAATEEEEAKEEKKPRARKAKKGKEAEAVNEEALVAVEEEEAKAEEPEATAEEPEATVEEPEAKAEEPEAKAEEPEAKAEDAKAETEKPKAKKKTKKKTEAEVEEKETGE
jgi:large subunit ribosomal protein L9